MTGTQGLLTRIAALRQRLEQAQGLARDVGSAAVELLNDAPSDQGVRLVQRVHAGHAYDADLDDALRQISATVLPAAHEPARLPARLTSRARRVIEHGRQLLAQLRPLSDDPLLQQPGTPLALLHREVTALTHTALRLVSELPDAASAQLQVCEGIDAVLCMAGQRLGQLLALLHQRRRERERIDTLAGLLTAVSEGRQRDLAPFQSLAECLLAEAGEGAPLRFLTASAEDPARFTACHCLNTAQVMARIVHQEPDLRSHAMESLIAALLHDVGMLGVPSAVLARREPLDDEARRVIESHCLQGAQRVREAWPTAPWLLDAVTSHHERIDGTGYPGGFRDSQISPLARLLAACDVYAALCAPRPHRAAQETRTALADVLLLAEQGLLDNQQAERLLHLSFYPVGSVVELADGAVGVVLATPAGRRELNSLARPVVAVLTNAQSQLLALPVYVDLARSEHRSIVRTLTPDERRTLLGRRYPEWV
jgi:HD-GYP domain-containing protein (c-di-GMP phosphodiesterase class II)